MKRKFLIYLFISIVFLIFSGCGNSDIKNEMIDSEQDNRVLDKVVFEKINECYSEIMTIYFRGQNVTGTEMREIYLNDEEAARAYEVYLQSDIYVNIRKSGPALSYEYTSKSTDDLFKDYKSKKSIIDSWTKSKGYLVRS